MRESIVTTSEGTYAELKRLLRAEGLFRSQWRYYAMKSSMTIGTLAVMVALALWSPNPAVLALSGIGFGLALTQIGMLGHDVAHRQVFRRKRWIALSGWVLGNLLMGVSYSWWTQKHNRHHANPNHLTKDPDANYPMFVIATSQIPSRSSYMRPVIAAQAFLLPVFGSMLFISMRAASFAHVFRRFTKMSVIQSLGLVAHLALFGLLLTQLGGWGSALVFLLLSQMTFGLYNVAVFAPNHKGMPTLADGETLDFLRSQVVTARNVRGSRLVDFLYGGLNYQIEHHLFPIMPRNRLKLAQPLVRRFCEQYKVPYHQTTVAVSYREIFSFLHRTSAPIREGTA